MTKQLLSTFLLFIVLFFCFTVCFAYSQVSVPIGPAGLDHHNTAPIGGMAVLAALGGAYAIKKLRNKEG
jgi:hypothetical protein